MLKALSYSSLFIALNAACLAIFYGILSGSVVAPRVALVALATFASYNAAQLAPLRLRRPFNERGLWIKDHSRLLWGFSLFALAGVGFLALRLSLADWLNFGHLFVLVLLYENTFGNKPLRKIPYLKPFFISYIWTMTCALPPFYDSWNPELLWHVPQCFLYMLGLCVLFDIRDQKEDRALGTKTFATRFGARNSKAISLVLMALSLAALVLLQQGLSVIFPIIYFGLVTALTLALKNDSGEYAYLYGVDGLIALKLGALLLAI